MKQLLAGAFVLSVLTACTAHPDTASSQAALDAQHSADRAAPSASAEHAADTPAKSPRGNLVKQIGEAAGVSPTQGGASTVTFSIEKITVDPKCTDGFSEKSAKGHYIALEMTVKTEPTYDSDEMMMFSINPYSFSVVGQDGVTETEVAATYPCVDPKDHLTSDALSPASQYKGVVMLESKSTSGLLVFRPAGSSGWEWAF
ncbi:hypothetical protein [Actinokineospora pegani]|uniref:hypothetical protein n=1 Tax=Actinokineospora pegani TaxID=2654637 RepID=UPI0012EAF8DA|nr:hypothetical protein [Actinokineospora pegani]